MLNFGGRVVLVTLGSIHYFSGTDVVNYIVQFLQMLMVLRSQLENIT